MKDKKRFSSGKEIKYLICNKVDLTQKVEVNSEEIEKFAKKNEMKVFEVSSFNKETVNEMFEKLVLDIINLMDEDNLKNRADSIKLQGSRNTVMTSNSNFSMKFRNYFSRNRNGDKCC